MVECLNIIALIFGFAGAMVLIKYQSPVVLWVTQEGEGMFQFTNSPTPQEREANKAKWRKYMRAYQAGVALLALGFLLQLAAAVSPGVLKLF
jgi:hypothetical protein